MRIGVESEWQGTASNELSAIVLTKNSERRLAECLGSIRELAAEIIVFDQGSTDQTIQISEKFGARVISRESDVITRRGFGVLRREAVSEARADWVFMLDSDEVISPGLARSVRHALASPHPHSGYRVYTIGIAFGKQRRLLSGYSAFPRLFQKDHIDFDDHKVHEGFTLRNGTLGLLNGTLLHYTYDNWSDLLRKVDLYSELLSQELKREDVSFVKEMIAVGKSLYWALVMQRGIADGPMGVRIAFAGALTRTIAYDKAREKWISKHQ
jgi:glycosyltransferase involved in cell wall biosynthesis